MHRSTRILRMHHGPHTGLRLRQFRAGIACSVRAVTTTVAYHSTITYMYLSMPGSKLCFHNKQFGDKRLFAMQLDARTIDLAVNGADGSAAQL